MTGPDATLRSIHATVLRAQTPPDDVPLTLTAGDSIRLGDPHLQRAGYIWVEDGSISAGWVPLDLIDITRSPARASKDYCSAELATQVGERVRLIWEDPAHAAWWCESRDSERGWVWSCDLQFDNVPA